MTATTRFKITIECQEDLHCGTGLDVSGITNGSQVRAQDGTPMIPRETLRQMLKEASRRLCSSGLHSDEAFVSLFGDGVGGRVWPSDLLLVGDQKLTLHSQTALKPKTRVAGGTTLRTIECVSRGSRFEGALEIGTEDVAAVQLAKDAMRFLRLLGGGRRRGLGLIRVRSRLSDEPLASASEAQSYPESDLIALRVWLRLDEPVCIGVGEQATYVLRSRDHIPGSTLLGALRSRWKAEASHQADSGIGTLLADGSSASFGDLLPYLPEEGGLPLGLPVSDLPLPAPATCRRPKRATPDSKSELATFGWAVSSPAPAESTSSPRIDILNEWVPGDAMLPSKAKGLGGESFVVPGRQEEGLLMYQTRKRVRPRNRIGPERQRVLKENGFFAVESLEPGQYFVGEIVLSGEQASTGAKALRDWLLDYQKGAGLRLGHGMGLVEVEEVEVLDPNGEAKPALLSGEDFDVVLLLTAPLVTTHGFGAATPSIESWLGATLAEVAKVVRIQVSNLVEQSAFHFSGLPKFSRRGLGRGSCIALKLKGEDPVAAIARLCRLGRFGIGEDTISGSGRFVVNHPIMTRRAWTTPQSSVTFPLDDVRKWKLVQRTFDGELGRKVDSASQWGRFVNVVEGLREATDGSSEAEALVSAVADGLGAAGKRSPWSLVLAGLLRAMTSGDDRLVSREDRIDFMSWTGRLHRRKTQAKRRGDDHGG